MLDDKVLDDDKNNLRENYDPIKISLKNRIKDKENYQLINNSFSIIKNIENILRYKMYKSDNDPDKSENNIDVEYSEIKSVEKKENNIIEIEKGFGRMPITFSNVTDLFTNNVTNKNDIVIMITSDIEKEIPKFRDKLFQNDLVKIFESDKTHINVEPSEASKHDYIVAKVRKQILRKYIGDEKLKLKIYQDNSNVQITQTTPGMFTITKDINTTLPISFKLLSIQKSMVFSKKRKKMIQNKNSKKNMDIKIKILNVNSNKLEENISKNDVFIIRDVYKGSENSNTVEKIKAIHKYFYTEQYIYLKKAESNFIQSDLQGGFKVNEINSDNEDLDYINSDNEDFDNEDFDNEDFDNEDLDDINSDNEDLDDINSDNEDLDNEDFDNEDFDNEDLSDINEDNYSGGESDDSLKIFGGNTNYGIGSFSPVRKQSRTKNEILKALIPSGQRIGTGSNIADTIKDKLFTAKTGKCFELGKKFNNTGDSKLEIKDAENFIEFMLIATFEFYIQLKEKMSNEGTGATGAGAVTKENNTYEIDKFFTAYLNRLYKFAKLNIYVIVNCTSILQELSKAIHILITKKLENALNNVDIVEPGRKEIDERKDRQKRGEETLADLMDGKDIFGKSSYFNMHSLAMMNFIFDTYNTAIPRIEDIIKSTHNTDERLDQISKYLTLKYDMTILGKDTSNEVNERYVEENNYINNLLKDLFPKMGFMDKSIMKNLKKIDKIIENNSDNTLLLQNELQDLINITFENGNILFENEKVSEMKKQDNSDMLQQEIDNLQNYIQKLKELQGLQGLQEE